jgi:hypothetical protein
MPTCFQLADASVHALAKEVMEAHHPELRMPDGEFVRLCIMMAFGDANSDEPSLKLHGYPAAAIVKVIPYDQRVDKRADAEIKIDQSQWDSFTENQQRALLDHEITHLEIQKDKDGFVKTDDAGRPKLGVRLHDWQLGGFRSIAERYGTDAIEVMNARAFDEKFGDVALAADKLFA